MHSPLHISCTVCSEDALSSTGYHYEGSLRSEQHSPILWGIPSVLWGVHSVLQRMIGTVWGCLELWRNIISTLADTISTVEDIQYCGGIPSILWGTPSALCRETVLWADTVKIIPLVLMVSDHSRNVLYTTDYPHSTGLSLEWSSYVFHNICFHKICLGRRRSND